MKKVLLIGASQIKDPSFIREYPDCYLVACDGGYQAFKEVDKEVDLFVGDFDTFAEKDLRSPKEIISLSRIKDDTDTLYALRRCLEKGYDTFYLYGCLGGKIEHTIANIQLLLFLLHHQAKGYLFDEDGKVLFLLHNDSLSFLQGEGMLSLFAIEKEVKGVSLTNLKYELHDQNLYNDYPLGISNEFLKDKTATISVKEGTLLVVAPKKSIAI